MYIRDLTESDADTYWALRLRGLRERPDAFGSSYEESVLRPMEQVRARLRALAPAEGRFMLGAFDDADDAGALVGMVNLTREDGLKDRHKAMLTGMYVAPEARGQGIGKALVDELIARARQLPGLEQIVLAVTTHNTEARALYHSAGFTIYGTEPHALRLPDGTYLDEDLMIRWLIPAPPEESTGQS